MAESQQSQPVEDATRSVENFDATKSVDNFNATKDTTNAISEATLEDTVQNATIVEQMQPNTDSSEASKMETEHDSECRLSSIKSEAITGESVKFTDLDTSNKNLCISSKDTVLDKFEDNETGNVDVLADMDVRDFSNDFATTFMLDEELEIEHNMQKKTDFSSSRR